MYKRQTYGNINTSDALYAIKKLVYEEGKYTLAQLHEAQMADFDGYEQIRKELLRQDKYGNDAKECDALANDLYEYVAKGIRQRGIQKGLGYYLIVISNNQTKMCIRDRDKTTEPSNTRMDKLLFHM